MIAIVDGNGKSVATFEDGEWTFLNEEFQQRVETLQIEGFPILGGEPFDGVDGDDSLIGDNIKWISPGDPEFDEEFWDAALDGDYKFEGEVNDARSDVTEVTE